MTEVSRAERIFRGMLGMGMTFAVLGGALAVALIVAALIFGGEEASRRGGYAIGVVFFGGIAITFVMGVIYAGLLALLARGRTFKQVSVAHTMLAGAAVGLLPLGMFLFMAPNDAQRARLLAQALTPLLTIPTLTCAVVATATLLIARRAKPELGGGEYAARLGQGGE